MKVGKLKKDKRFESRNDRSLGIQTWGDNNDYPQQVFQVVNASATGKPCVEVYKKFISGRGFIDKDIYNLIINRKGQTSDYLLNQISYDHAHIGGFAIHINYNAAFQIVELQHFPIEELRFEKMDENGNFNRIARHPDWARQFTQLRKWRKEDIVFFDFYNPDPEIIQSQVDVAGGWSKYNGQIFFYSNQGEKVYPLPVYDNVLTDMNTQEGISNVSNRNARNNFFVAGIITEFLDDTESEEQESELEKAILDFQGDEEACKVMYSSAKSKEEKPEFTSFRPNSYDKEFDTTRKAVRDDIGGAFNQPPILRAEDVGANFGADLMKNAYNYYNSVIENERLVLERVFIQIFRNWKEQLNGNYAIDPLSYNVDMSLVEELGDKGFERLMGIIENEKMSSEQKKKIIKELFDFSEDRINNLIVMQ